MKLEVLRDPFFAKGFYVGNEKGLDYPDYRITVPFQESDPEWVLSQWNSEHSLSTERSILINHDSYEVKNKSKLLKKGSDDSLTLEILGSKEYKKPRVLNESWPHLLIEQKYTNVFLGRVKGLLAHLDMDFLTFKNFMGGELDPELHTMQIGWMFRIGDLDVRSYNFGDFFFFGLPIIDYPRYDFPVTFFGEDYGKRDATHKIIISIDPHKYLEGKIVPGAHIAFDFDILPEIKAAFERAQEKGYMKNQQFSSLQIVSTKLGFEDTGTFDGKIRINHVSLEAIQ